MVEKKVIKKTIKSSGKDEKVSVEEINKMKEEFLARIDAEIGEDVEEVILDEKEAVAESPESEPKEEFEKEMLEEEKAEGDEDVKEDIKEDNGFVEKENKEGLDEVESVKLEKKDRGDGEEEEQDKHREIQSTFSAAEFGLVDSKNNKGKNIILFLVVFLLVAIISALFYLFSTGILKIERPQGDADIAPTEAPSPTPTPVELDRAALSVQILNGSGKSGVAATMQAFMEDLGYEDLEIGNADNDDYKNVTVQIKEEYKNLAKLIDEDLANDYIVNGDYESLEDDSEYDVIIIVGSESDDETVSSEEADE